MKKHLVLKAIAAVAILFVAHTTAQATPVYVGSWLPDQGAWWTTDPLAYSGVGAAQLLFGPGTYEISTVDANPADIDHQAWYNIIGVGPAIFSDTYFRGTEGLTHYEDVYVYDPSIDTVSTYVHDFGSAGRNYAFRVSGVPDGGTTATLLGMAMLGLAAVRRKLS